MFYITGDTHRNFDRIRRFSEELGTTKDDVLIILGDAEINRNGDNSDRALKKELAGFPLTFFCIQGDSEKRPEEISSYREERWNGGTVYVEPDYPNLLFAKDGEVFDLDGKKTLVIGRSGEMPERKVDAVLSHTAPLKYVPEDAIRQDLKTERGLDAIEEKLEYKEWWAGHFHVEKKIGRLRLTYREVRRFSDVDVKPESHFEWSAIHLGASPLAMKQKTDRPFEEVVIPEEKTPDETPK